MKRRRGGADDGSVDPLIGLTIFADDLLPSQSSETFGRGGGFSAVLPVAELGPDESIEADSIDDGERYLAFVRQEASLRPIVARAAFAYPTPPSTAGWAPAAASEKRLPGEPSDAWKASFVARFKRIRLVRQLYCALLIWTGAVRSDGSAAAR